MALTPNSVVTWTLPAKYDDNVTPWPASDYLSAAIFRDGTQVGTIQAPALTFEDKAVPVGDHKYTVQVTGKSGSVSDVSAPFDFVEAAPPIAAPVITSVTPSA